MPTTRNGSSRRSCSALASVVFPALEVPLRITITGLLDDGDPIGERDPVVAADARAGVRRDLLEAVREAGARVGQGELDVPDRAAPECDCLRAVALGAQ